MNQYKKDVARFLLDTKDGTPFYVFDTETTGLNPVNAEIIQFSALKCRVLNGGYEVLEPFDIYINPGHHIPDEVTKINHITDEMVKGSPNKTDAAKRIYEFLGERPILVGYNSVSFDEKFMKDMYVTALGIPFAYSSHLDVFGMAKDKCEPPRKLADIVARMGLNTGDYGFHSSLEDVKATLDVMVKLLPEYEKCEPPTHRVAIVGHGRWQKNGMDRMYINTSDRSLRVFYDLNDNKWESSDPNLDLGGLVSDVYASVGATGPEDFVQRMKISGWI